MFNVILTECHQVTLYFLDSAYYDFTNISYFDMFDGESRYFMTFNQNDCDQKVYLIYNITYHFTLKTATIVLAIPLSLYSFENEKGIVETIIRVLYIKLYVIL